MRSRRLEQEEDRRAELRQGLEKLEDLIHHGVDSSFHSALDILTKAKSFIWNLEEKERKTIQLCEQLEQENKELQNKLLSLQRINSPSLRVCQETSLSECSASSSHSTLSATSQVNLEETVCKGSNESYWASHALASLSSSSSTFNQAQPQAFDRLQYCSEQREMTSEEKKIAENLTQLDRQPNPCPEAQPTSNKQTQKRKLSTYPIQSSPYKADRDELTENGICFKTIGGTCGIKILTSCPVSEFPVLKAKLKTETSMTSCPVSKCPVLKAKLKSKTSKTWQTLDEKSAATAIKSTYVQKESDRELAIQSALDLIKNGTSFGKAGQKYGINKQLLYQRWKKAILRALEFVENGLTFYEAGQVSGIPESALRDHLKKAKEKQSRGSDSEVGKKVKNAICKESAKTALSTYIKIKSDKEAKIQNALKSIEDGMSITKASEMYGIGFYVLNNRLKNAKRKFKASKTEPNIPGASRETLLSSCNNLKNYNETDVISALKLVENGMSRNKAGQLFGISEVALRMHCLRARKISKGPDFKVKKKTDGRKAILSETQEQEIVAYILKMELLGYTLSRWQAIEIALNVAKDYNLKKEPFSGTWYFRFKERHSLEIRRHKIVHSRCIDDREYFKTLVETLGNLNIEESPASIWSVDETIISFDPEFSKPPKILAYKEKSPNPSIIGKFLTMTIVSAANALGETLPPYLVFKKVPEFCVSDEVLQKALTGTVFSSSESGWCNSETFLEYFCNHFLENVHTRPLILLYDGHSTHYTPNMSEVAKQKGVHLFPQPTNNSHFLKPEDCSIFSSFKRTLHSSLQKFGKSYPTKTFPRDEVPNLIASAYRTALTPPIIMSGFRMSGVFPFSSSAVNSLHLPSTLETSNTESETKSNIHDERAETSLNDSSKSCLQTSSNSEKYINPYKSVKLRHNYKKQNNKESAVITILEKCDDGMSPKKASQLSGTLEVTQRLSQKNRQCEVESENQSKVTVEKINASSDSNVCLKCGISQPYLLFGQCHICAENENECTN